MLTKNEFDAWELEVQGIISKVTIPWELHLLQDKLFKDENGNGRLYLQVQFDDIDNVTGLPGYRSYCRKWYLSPYMTTQEIVRTCWLAYFGAVTHEAQEKFKYKGEMIYGPHISVDNLSLIAFITDERPSHMKPDEVQL